MIESSLLAIIVAIAALVGLACLILLLVCADDEQARPQYYDWEDR